MYIKTQNNTTELFTNNKLTVRLAICYVIPFGTTMTTSALRGDMLNQELTLRHAAQKLKDASRIRSLLS